MNKEFYDKHSKDLGCHICSNLQQCITCDEPLWINCSRIFYKERTADLEAKLAESEEKCKKAYQEGLLQKQFDKDVEIEQLKQQLAKIKEEYEQLDLSTGYYISDLKEELAEKDEEIKKLKTLIDAIDKYGQYDNDAENLIILNPDNCYSNGHKLIIKTDKIDYAVEQLKKVKDSILDFSNGYWRYFMTDGAEYMLSSDLESCLEEYIDQLITEIKGEN